ncbi:hypothetical protein BGX38DRAFT_1274095 [Terfezia claveryi]|nr:hypothetical protein BGX38DRAFT_1274095 [Terfezia claveryi]
MYAEQQPIPPCNLHQHGHYHEPISKRQRDGTSTPEPPSQPQRTCGGGPPPNPPKKGKGEGPAAAAPPPSPPNNSLSTRARAVIGVDNKRARIVGIRWLLQEERRGEKIASSLVIYMAEEIDIQHGLCMDTSASTTSDYQPAPRQLSRKAQKSIEGMIARMRNFEVVGEGCSWDTDDEDGKWDSEPNLGPWVEKERCSRGMS